MARDWKILTTAKPGTPEFNEAHKGKIGGHAAASIMGVGRKTPLQVWAELTGKLDEPPKPEPNEDGDEDETQPPEKEWLEMGNVLEDPVAKLWEKRSGRKTLPSPGTVQHPSLPYLIATPDRLIVPEAPHTQPGVLEIKTTGAVKLKDWLAEPPVEAQVQQHLYFACLGLEHGSIAALVGTFGFRLLWSDTVINPVFMDAMLNELSDFYEHYVRTDIPPPATGRDLPTIKFLYPEADGSTVQLTPELELAFEQFESAKREIRELEKLKDETHARLLEAIGTASYARGEGVSFSAKTTHVEGRTQIVQPYSFRTIRRCK